MEQAGPVRRRRILYSGDRTVDEVRRETFTVKHKVGNKTGKVIKAKTSLTKIRSRLIFPMSPAGASGIKMPRNKLKAGNKTDEVEISKGKVTKTKGTGTAKKTKGTGTAKKTKGTGTAKKTKVTGTAKNTRDTGTSEKTEEDAGELNTNVKTSRIKVPKEKSIAGNKMINAETTDKKMGLVEEVCAAITTIGDSRKGVTSQAIKSYIFGKRGVENGESGYTQLNKRVNNALRKAIENGTLERPTTSKGNAPMVSALGRFTLSKKVVKPKVSEKSKAKKVEGSETEE